MTELTPIRRGRCAGAGNWQTQYQALQMTAREAAELIRDCLLYTSPSPRD